MPINRGLNQEWFSECFHDNGIGVIAAVMMCIFYLAVFVLMGVSAKPTIWSYFSKNLLLKSKIFSSVMSCDKVLCKFLHFPDSTKTGNFTGPKKLFKIYPIVTPLNSKFKTSYTLSKNISVDESLLLWKSALSFRQYIPLKAAKFLIKSFDYANLLLGIHVPSLLYWQVDGSLMTPQSNKSESVVLILLEPLFGKSFTVCTDNWYNSPKLSKPLKTSKTDFVGTLSQQKKIFHRSSKILDYRKVKLQPYLTLL